MVEYTGTSPSDGRNGALDVHKSAWKKTLQELEAQVERLEDDGWQTVAFPAGHTGPEVPTDGDEDNNRFGLTHIIPGNKADELLKLREKGSFEDYQVFKNSVHGQEFVLTAILDHPTESVVLIAGNYRQQRAEPLKEIAMDEDVMYSHIRKLDGSYIATFEHEDPAHFFPELNDS
ncbi:uncharacterized protein HHUB_3530 [Halobacterium hubeiense]|uniref:Uncharacterized protein n=1 Tax=Halobacterium hubeiense TaxID=1407499 RepID=A0A0U5H7A5_9EURY|nr:hypothetical protein [Halobacterium hubeiense]CQH61730.1 uncharacterized protein HHUB_3530 [Halobacterium hubeiense]